MKRLGLIFVLLLSFSLFLIPNKSLALIADGQPGCFTGTDCTSGYCDTSANPIICKAAPTKVANGQSCNQSADCTSGYCNGTTMVCDNVPSATNPAGTNPVVNNPSKCDYSPTTWGWCISDIITFLIKEWALNVAGFFLWLSANLLNYSIQFGILNFKDWAPDTIYPLWQMVRQIISLCVVFAGLYIGFMYIINKQDTFIKRYIPWLVVFALFVNFSYPISRAAIDISNVISLNIYTQAVGAGALTGNENETAGAQIMGRMGLQSLVMSSTGPSSTGGGIVKQINTVPSALLMVLLVLYASYILGFAAILMMIRTFVLVFMIIGSPLLFVDSVMPKFFGDAVTKFRTIFWEQLALSVVFMIMLYLTLAVMNIFSIKTGGVNALTVSDTSGVAVFFNIIMMLIMLHIMLKVTLSTSGSIGSSVEGMYKTAAMGVAMGGAGMMGRTTLGRVAERVAGSEWMDKAQGSWIGRKAYDMSSGIANSTFDARNSTIAQKAAGVGGIDMGKGTDRTYLKDLKTKQDTFASKYNSIRNEEARTKFADRMTGHDKGAIGKAYSFAKDGTKVAMPALQEEATKINKAVDVYGIKGGKGKQDFFNKQTGAAKTTIKDKVAAEEINKLNTETEARKENDEIDAIITDKKFDQYNKIQNQAKQSYYNAQSSDTQSIMYDHDKLEAEKENTRINQTQAIEGEHIPAETKPQLVSKQGNTYEGESTRIPEPKTSAIPLDEIMVQNREKKDISLNFLKALPNNDDNFKQAA